MIFTISTTSFQMASSGKNPSFLKHSSSSPGVNGKRSEANFSKDEVDLIVRMYNLVGERWSIIAGRIPGRNAEEIKEYWMSRCASADCSRVE